MAHRGHSPWSGTCDSTSTGSQYRPLTKVMINKRLGSILRPRTVFVLAVLLGHCLFGTAQDVSLALLQPGEMQPAAFTPAPRATSVQPVALPEAPSPHRFWDRENSILFATSAAFSAADFVVTRDNLRSGGRELNPVTRLFSGSTPGLAMNFAGEAAGVLGVSYLLHKTGHHKMERMVSMLNIGSSAAAVTFDLAHR
jgi:hypothetical protein